MQLFYSYFKIIFVIGISCSCVLLQYSIFCEEFFCSVAQYENGIVDSSDPTEKSAGQEGAKEMTWHLRSLKNLDKDKQTYTINFNKVSIIEYIRFVSKITRLNFIFNEDELDFTITIISEEEVPPSNIMSVLIQVLRIHGLVVLEEDNNLLITKIRSVTQLATVVSSDSGQLHHKSPLITRIFRIKNASLHTVAAVIKPMLSDSALLEVSAETNHLIVTDITTNVDKISFLLAAIDTPIDQKIYLYSLEEKKSVLILQAIGALSKEIKLRNGSGKLTECLDSVKWIQDSSSLLFIGDGETIVQVKDLLATIETQAFSPISQRSFFVYPIKQATFTQLESSLRTLAQDLQKSLQPDDLLIEALNGFSYNKEVNSLIFIGEEMALARLKQTLPMFDVSSAASKDFFIYYPRYIGGELLQQSVLDLATNLQKYGLSNDAFIQTLLLVNWVPAIKALVFIGSDTVLSQVKAVIGSIDKETEVPSESVDQSLALAVKSEFFVYQPLHLSCTRIKDAFADLGKNFQKAGLSDADLLATIDTVQYVEGISSLLFTGTAKSLEKIREILIAIDVSDSNPEQEEKNLLVVESAILTKPVISSRKDGVSTPPSRVEPSTIASETMGTNFSVYSPKHQTGEELINILKEFKQHLEAAGVSDKDLFNTIDKIRYIPKTASLIIPGDADSVAKVEGFLKRFDVTGLDSTKPVPSIESIQDSSFLIYKLQHHQGADILSALKQAAADLSANAQDKDQQLVHIINSLQWIRVTNSLLASGDPGVLAKIREIIQSLDVPLKQVFIEILVVETNVHNAQNFGLQWGARMKYRDRLDVGIGNFPAQSPSIAASSNPVQPRGNVNPGIASGISETTTGRGGSGIIPFLSGFDFGVIGDIIMHKGKSFLSLGAFVNALQADTDSTVVLNPKIITQDNRTSSIFVGQNIPFVGSEISTSAQIVSSTTNINYRDIGFNLTITPTIGSSDIITLDIDADISQVTGSPSIAITNSRDKSGSVTGIQTSHTSMKTRVQLPNEHFVVLSGMISDQKFHSKTGIPCLGGLPLFGAIFSEADRLAVKQNVIFFIRPHIINTYAEYKAITERQEDLYKDAAVLPVLKEDFDAAIDLVKQPDDE
jgi:type II secretory pathway component GspD/PulD (secretin)